MKRFLTFCFLFLSFYICLHALPFKEVEDIERPDSVWEESFQQRIKTMWGENIAKYKIHPQDPTEDCGKRYWSRLLSKLEYRDQIGVSLDSLLSVGNQLVMSPHAGSFRKPFSCAGFAMYYFNWKDSIAKLDPAQQKKIYERVDTMWRYLMRSDHLLDACCGYNEQGGKEFNSENFQWMLKAAGYLFSHELQDKKVNDRLVDATKKEIKGIEVRDEESGEVKIIDCEEVDLISYFDNSIINLTKALYNAGRVEWNSNNYFGHTLNPLHTIYQCAEKSGDPNWEKNKKRAQGCLDWMLLEAALHYRDGFQVAADSRAKNGSFLPFKGSYFPYTIPYFADSVLYPSFGENIWKSRNPGDAEIGFLLSSSYRPPKIILDIAQKKFSLPVEIQSAKPFYHIDKGRYFNADGTIKGESAYSNWNNPKYGRRFEFETLYIGNRFTMSSVATGRPDGSLGTFSEECLWRLGVDGENSGCIMLSGNAGDMESTTGRYPWHEISQYRNMMMQLVKSETNNSIWIAVPKVLSTNDSLIIKDDNSIYLNAGNGVFISVKATGTPEITVASEYGESGDYDRIEFKWDTSELGGLIIEVDETPVNQSFIRYVEINKDRIPIITGERCSYVNSAGNLLEMEFVNPKPYLMVENTFDTPDPNPWPDGGTYPKVWHDGEEVDFNSWDSYKTVFGSPVVNQKWGSGCLELNSKQESVRICVDPDSGEVKFYSSD